MSRSTIASFAVVILLLIAGGYYWYSNMAAPVSTDESLTTPKGPDTGDASLEQTAAAIDALVDGFVADDAAVSASLTDTPVTQSY
ncbi:MAG: hypothetical protein RIQ56_7 [Candidatus Parcubacteria bacterium]|jgi:hypothetical protein